MGDQINGIAQLIPYMRDNEGQRVGELYQEALSANPIEARAAILSLQARAAQGDEEAATALENLIPELQRRVGEGFPDARQHLEEIARGVDRNGQPTEAARSASVAIVNGLKKLALTGTPAQSQAAIESLKQLAKNGNLDALNALGSISQETSLSGQPTDAANAAKAALLELERDLNPDIGTLLTNAMNGDDDAIAELRNLANNGNVQATIALRILGQ